MMDIFQNDFVVGDMSTHEASNLSGPLMSNTDSKVRRASRTADEIFFEADPVFSDSEDESEHFRQILSISTINKTTSEKSMPKNSQPSQSTNLLMDQLLMMCCDQCTCCKNIKDFLKLLRKSGLSSPSPCCSSYDSAFGTLASNDSIRVFQMLTEKVTPPKQIKIISCQTLTPSKSSKKFNNLSRSNVAGNITVETANRHSPETDESSLLDSSRRTYKSKQNSAGRNTKSNICNNNDDFLPNIQNAYVITQKLEKKTLEKGKIKRRSKILVDTGRRRRIGKNVNSDPNSSEAESNGFPRKMKNNTNNSDTRSNSPSLEIIKKRKTESSLGSKDDSAADLQLENKTTEATIPKFSFDSSYPYSQQKKVDYEKKPENKRSVSTKKKQRGRPRSSLLNVVKGNSFDDDLNCQLDPCVDSSREKYKSKQNSAGRNTKSNIWKKDDVFLPDIQNANVITHKLEKKTLVKGKIKRRNRILVGTGRRRRIGTNVINDIHSLDANSNGFPRKMKNNTNNSDIRNNLPSLLGNPDSQQENEDYGKSLGNKISLPPKKKRGRPRNVMSNSIIAQKENGEHEKTLENEILVLAEKKQRDRPRNSLFNLSIGDSSDVDLDSQPGHSEDSSFSSFFKRKARSLYTCEEWVNSDEFLKLSGAEY